MPTSKELTQIAYDLGVGGTNVSIIAFRVVNIMEASGEYYGPYDPLQRAFLEQYLVEEITPDRIDYCRSWLAKYTSPVLRALTLSNSTYYIGDGIGTYIGQIGNTMAGSTLSVVSDNRVTITGNRLFIGSPQNSTSTFDLTIRESWYGLITKDTVFNMSVVVVPGGVAPAFLPTLSTAPSLVLSTSRLLGSYTGPALRVQRVSDNVEQDIGFGIKYLDTGTANAFRGASDLGVKTFYDQSGGGFNATQATKTDQPGLFNKDYTGAPVVSLDSKTVTTVVSKRMSTAGPTVAKNAFTIFMLVAPNVSLKGSMLIAGGTAGNALAMYTRMNAAATMGNVGLIINNDSATNSTVIPSMQPSVLAMRGGTDRVIRVNGIKTILSGTAPASDTVVGFDLGRVFASFTASDFDALYDCFAVVVYPATLSDADCILVEAALTQQVPVVTNQSIKLIYDGDSRTEGFGATQNEAWPRKLTRQISTPVYAFNLGVGGQTLNTMALNVAARVTAQYDASKKNIVLMGGPGINDFSASRTASQVQTSFIAYANGIHANQLLIAATVPLHTSHTTGQNNERIAYNTWLRANWSTYAERLVDLDVVPGLDVYNTTYWIDGVHFKDAGHDLFVSAFKPAIESLI